MRQDSASAKKMVTFSILLQLKQLDPQSAQSVESVKTLYVMKSRPLKAEPSSSLLKSKALDGDQRADMFHEVRPRSHAHRKRSVSSFLFRTDSIQQFHFDNLTVKV